MFNYFPISITLEVLVRKAHQFSSMKFHENLRDLCRDGCENILWSSGKMAVTFVLS